MKHVRTIKMLGGCLDGRTLNLDFPEEGESFTVDATDIARQIAAANTGYIVTEDEVAAAMAQTDEASVFLVHLSRICAVKLAAAKQASAGHWLS